MAAVLQLGAALRPCDAHDTLPTLHHKRHAPVTVLFELLGRMPRISTSSPVRTMPCSTRPVTTVPRPCSSGGSSSDGGDDDDYGGESSSGGAGGPARREGEEEQTGSRGGSAGL